MSEKLKLYLISQEQNRGYDTYDSAVVAAYSEHEATLIHPSEYIFDENEPVEYKRWDYFHRSWATDPTHVTATLIGDAIDCEPNSVICASFNAG